MAGGRRAWQDGFGGRRADVCSRGLPVEVGAAQGGRMRLSPMVASCLMVLCAVFAAGCGTFGKKDKNQDVVVARFLIESASGEAGAVVRLPQSGTAIGVVPKTFFTEYDVSNVEVLQGEFGPALMFKLTPEAGRDLFRHTVANQGRRIVVTLNGQAVGAVRVDRPLSQGFIVAYVEMPGADLEKVAKAIVRTSEDGRKEMERKR